MKRWPKLYQFPKSTWTKLLKWGFVIVWLFKIRYIKITILKETVFFKMKIHHNFQTIYHTHHAWVNFTINISPSDRTICAIRPVTFGHQSNWSYSSQDHYIGIMLIIRPLTVCTLSEHKPFPLIARLSPDNHVCLFIFSDLLFGNNNISQFYSAA